MNRLETVVATPAPASPSGAKPSLPNISTQAIARLSGSANVQIARIQPGRCRAEKKQRSTTAQSAGRNAHCSVRTKGADSAASAGSWPSRRRIASAFHSTTQTGIAIATEAHNPWRTVRRTSRTEWRLRPSSWAMSGAVALATPMAKIRKAK